MTNIFAHIGKILFKTDIKTTTNTIIADEPADKGGQDAGFSPSELLAASLGACTSITLKMYAERKGWQLSDIHVEVNFEKDSEGNKSHFTRKIELTGNLTEEQKTRLLAIANLCPIHKTLTNPIEIDTQLI